MFLLFTFELYSFVNGLTNHGTMTATLKVLSTQTFTFFIWYLNLAVYEKGVMFHSVSLWMCSLYYSQQTRVIIMNSCEILWIIWLPQRNRTYVQTKTYTLMIIHNHQRMYITHIKGSLDKHSVLYPDNKDYLAKKKEMKYYNMDESFQPYGEWKKQF